MENLFKEIIGNKELLVIFAAIAAILILLIVLFIISKMMYPENGKSSSYIGRGNSRNIVSNRGNEFWGTNGNQKSSGGKSSSNNQFSNSWQNNKQHGVVKDDSDGTSESNEEWKKFADKEKEKQNQVHHYLNDDGTMRTDITFESVSDDPAPAPFSPKYEYLETANNGQFRRLLSSDEKCFFRTWEENGIRKFEFHGNVDKALANINAIFDDVCEIEGRQNGATQIENAGPGTLNSQLKVEIPAKIKLS